MLGFIFPDNSFKVSIPFDIPENWKWCRLSSSTYNWGQKTPDKTFCYIDVGSINNISHTLNIENTVVEAKDASSRAKKIVQKGDVIFATIRSYLKNICIIDRDFPYEPIVSTAFAVMHCRKGLLNKYLYYYLLSPTFMRFANASDKSKGVAYPAIGEKDFFNGLIALPPLAEQKRIVAKIEELLPLVDRYAVAYEKLEQFNAKFPEDMKKSILQYAIQGKLVDQRSEEGTGEELYQQIQTEKQRLIKEGKIKKEKPLPEIAEDEIPFDIPESWKWVRIGALTYNWGQKTPDSRFCYIDVGSVNNTSHTLNKENTVVEAKDASSRAKKIVKKGDVIFATIRPYLKNICIIDKNFPCEPIASTAFAVMHCPEGLLNKYLYYYLLSPTFMRFANARDKAKGVAYPAIGEKDFFNGIIALPPVAEQKRIVAKLEEILPLCERLK